MFSVGFDKPYVGKKFTKLSPINSANAIKVKMWTLGSCIAATKPVHMLPFETSVLTKRFMKTSNHSRIFCLILISFSGILSNMPLCKETLGFG